MHSRSIKPPTKAEKKRMARIVELGCVACRLDGDWPEACGLPEIHHLLDGGVRRGHSFTVGLGSWHHRGIVVPAFGQIEAMTRSFGPSLYHDARDFHARYGSDEELLAYQNKLLAEEE